MEKHHQPQEAKSEAFPSLGSFYPGSYMEDNAYGKSSPEVLT